MDHAVRQRVGATTSRRDARPRGAPGPGAPEPADRRARRRGRECHESPSGSAGAYRDGRNPRSPRRSPNGQAAPGHRAARPACARRARTDGGAGSRVGIPVGMESPRGVNDPSLAASRRCSRRPTSCCCSASGATSRSSSARRSRRTAASSKRSAGAVSFPTLEAMRTRGAPAPPMAGTSRAIAYRPPDWDDDSHAERLHPVAACREVQKLLDRRRGLGVRRRRVRPVGAGLPRRAAPRDQRRGGFDRRGAAFRGRRDAARCPRRR